MKEELKELISKHLPSLAAGEMSKYIEQAEKDKVQLELANIVVSDLKKVSEDLRTKLQAFLNKERDLIAKEANLTLLSDDLKEKAYNLKVAELTYQLAAEKESKQSIYNLVNTFVANPRAIETLNSYKNYTHGTDYHPTGSHHYPTSSSEHTTIEKRETKDRV